MWVRFIDDRGDSLCAREMSDVPRRGEWVMLKVESDGPLQKYWTESVLWTPEGGYATDDYPDLTISAHVLVHLVEEEVR